MSLYLPTSPKHCARQGLNVKKPSKRLVCSISTTLLSILSAATLIWLTLHPSTPQFHLIDAGIYQLRLASPSTLNSTIQFTIASKNPNTRVGIYYDKLRAYASYKGQQITSESSIPPFYQGHEDTNVLSAFLYGVGVPVPASFGYEVSRDQVVGKIVVKIKVDGGLRWKVGSWISGGYHVDVNCVAVMGFRQGTLSSMKAVQCSTSV